MTAPDLRDDDQLLTELADALDAGALPTAALLSDLPTGTLLDSDRHTARLADFGAAGSAWLVTGHASDLSHTQLAAWLVRGDDGLGVPFGSPLRIVLPGVQPLPANLALAVAAVGRRALAERDLWELSTGPARPQIRRAVWNDARPELAQLLRVLDPAGRWTA